MVTNTTGALASPTNFFAANSNLLNAAVNNLHGSGGGGGGYSPDNATIVLNGSGFLSAAPMGAAITNFVGAFTTSIATLIDGLGTNAIITATNVLARPA